MAGLIKFDELKTENKTTKKGSFNGFYNNSMSLNNDSPQLHQSDKLVNALPDIQPNQIYHLQSFGKWSLHHMVLHVLDKIGPSDLTASTYAICQKSMQALFNRNKTGDLKQVRFVMDPEVRNKSHKALAFLRGITTEIGLKSCHAKCTVIDNQHHAVTIISSANWSVNRKIEVYCIDTHRSTAEYYKELWTRVIKEYPISAYGI